MVTAVAFGTEAGITECISDGYYYVLLQDYFHFFFFLSFQVVRAVSDTFSRLSLPWIYFKTLPIVRDTESRNLLPKSFSNDFFTIITPGAFEVKKKDLYSVYLCM